MKDEWGACMSILPRESEIENRIALVVLIRYNNCIYYSCTLLFVEQHTVVIFCEILENNIDLHFIVLYYQL